MRFLGKGDPEKRLHYRLHVRPRRNEKPYLRRFLGKGDPERRDVQYRLHVRVP